MFGLGDLFQEDNAEPRQCCEIDRDPGIGFGDETLPAFPKPTTGLCGIYNQGATCYMNSLLQTLVMTPEFRESLFSISTDELGSLEGGDTKQQKVRVIPLKLQHLFARLLLLNAQATSTSDLTDSFGWSNNEELIQHDVQELNRILFSAIEESLVGTSGQNMIQKLYHGDIVNQIVCEECGKMSEQEEHFLDLCLAVSGSKSVDESLSKCFIQTEDLSDSNKYYCGSCNKLVNAKKCAKIRHLPPLLTISLLRFRFDFQKQERYKETNKFTFPLELDMRPYIENKSAAGSTQYELFSVVNHSGGAHGGHYTAYIRDIDSLGSWTDPSDAGIPICPDIKSGKVDLIECDSPVELIQVILNKCPSKGMPVDKLCMEINNQTGVSWNKRFKSRYGPINKFLKKHEDVFKSVNNCVYIRQSMPPDISQLKSEAADCTHKSRKQSAPPEPGQCWFNFDDTHVCAVKTKDLEKLFVGKSSAYMLFYRRKDLSRPPEAQGNPRYKIPEHLVQLIQEENRDLDKQRKMYEIKMNMVLLKLLFPQLLTWRDGALHTKDNMLSYVELTVDKRKHVADLLELIEETYGELITGSYVVHFAKLLPAGIHIYHCISDAKDRAISELDIVDKGFLLVWDGRQINGDEVLTGVDNEPVQLTIEYGQHKHITHAFCKQLTLGQVKDILCNLLHLEASETILSHGLDKGICTDVKQLMPEDQGKTLVQMNIKDGDRLIVENHLGKSKSDQAIRDKVWDDLKNVLSYQVENRCGKTKGDWPVKIVQVPLHATVGELKEKVVREFCAGDLDQCVCRLRPEDDNLGLLPPMPECVKLIDSGIKPNSKIILEPGIAPQSDQLCLTFSCDKLCAGHENLEIVISSQKTVRDLLHLIIEKSGNQGIQWHLRRTNWCGEAAELLDDLDLTLMECQLKSGDHLLLEEGLLPPKGYVKLKIFLYPTLSQKKLSCHEMLAAHTKHINGMVNVAEENCEPSCMGDIMIPVRDTVEDLKLMILTLPEGDNLIVPTVDFLRVRLVEDQCLTTVLKDQRNTLQRLKITNDRTLGVQLLHEEENLGVHDVLLEVRVHMPDTRMYFPSIELVWNTSDDSSPAGLKQALANQLSVPANRLVIAKYNPKKYEWLVIEDTVSVKNGNQKCKKKAGKKINLKQAPYHVKDGCIIGVKDLQYEHKDIEDFCTQSDLDGKERLKEEAEQKRRRREELRAAGSNTNMTRKYKEMAIKIHVDNFR